MLPRSSSKSWPIIAADTFLAPRTLNNRIIEAGLPRPTQDFNDTAPPQNNATRNENNYLVQFYFSHTYTELPPLFFRPFHLTLPKPNIQPIDLRAVANGRNSHLAEVLELCSPNDLEALGSKFLYSTIICTRTSYKAPTTVEIILDPSTPIVPTLALALYDPYDSKQKPVIRPIIDAPFAFNCNLGREHFPRAPLVSYKRPGQKEYRVTIPVKTISFYRPASGAFSMLERYFYTKNKEALLESLLPAPPPPGYPTEPRSIHRYVLALARTCDSPTIQKSIVDVLNLYSNVCMLEVPDEDLWYSIQLAWKTNLLAFAYATNQAWANPVVYDVEREYTRMRMRPSS